MTGTATTTAPTSYRRFAVTVTADEFVITEVAPSTAHPAYSGSSDWYSHATRDGVWMRARAQHLPVRFVGRDESETRYGVVFSAEAFEKACYSGYVAYGISMSDGYYAPVTFDAWVYSFRRGTDTHSLDYNDCGNEVKAALPTYLATR